MMNDPNTPSAPRPEDPSSSDPVWSDAARALWDEYSTRLRERLQSQEVDAGEVVSDLHRHLLEEQRRHDIDILSEDGMANLLRRFGLPDVPVKPTPSRKSGSGFRRTCRALGPACAWIFLVILPALTLLNEAVYRDASLHYRNLFPHWLLFVLAAIVPVHKAIYIWKRQHGADPLSTPLDQALHGAGMLISLWFTILLIPMAPIAGIGAFLFFWTIIGLLGHLMLAPAYCFLHSIIITRRHSSEGSTFQPHFVTGLLVAFMLGLTAYVQVGQREVALEHATDTTDEVRNNGIRQAGKLFSDHQLGMRLFGPGRMTNPLPFGGLQHHMDTEERRQLYYRITGHDFPGLDREYGLFMKDSYFFSNEWSDSWNLRFDAHLGGTEVGPPRPNIELVTSRLDSSVHLEGRVSYTEWTLVLKNHSEWRNEEARFLMKLPSGGVVSRVTLWINGEPREAAFGTTRQTREAYQQVVQRNRDPLLVTQAGRDLVLAQCFPILPEQTMKVRIGVTAPLHTETDDSVRFPLPRMAQSNIGYETGLPDTRWWIESASPFQWQGTPVPQQTVDGENLFVLETEQPTEPPSPSAIHPMAVDAGTPSTAWAASTRLKEGGMVIQTWEAAEPTARPFVLLVDRSASMAEHAELLSDFLSEPPDALKSVVLSGFPATAIPPGDAAEKLGADDFTGGPDPIPALLLALREAARSGAERIVWLHGPVPFLYEQEDLLDQYAERRPNPPPILSLSLQPGFNALEQHMLPPFRYSEITPKDLPTVGSLSRLAEGHGIHPAWTPVRTVADAAPADAVQTSDHLVRLWARDRIMMDLIQNKRDLTEAQVLGVTHQLVTPVTGAVVLETQAQYDQNDLEPVDPNSVPSIPEPETWLLLIVLCAAIIWLRHRSRPCEAA